MFFRFILLIWKIQYTLMIFFFWEATLTVAHFLFYVDLKQSFSF